MTAIARDIEYLPLVGLNADPRNPKKHDLPTINLSIDRFGVIDPIILDGRTGYIISGHGRAETFRRMKDTGQMPPDGVTLSSDGDWLVPVVTGWSSRTDQEARAALVALNRTTELGGWDNATLLDILEALDEDNALEGVGYTQADIKALNDLAAKTDSVGRDLNLTDVAWAMPSHDVQRGDVWEAGHHLLVCARLHDEHHLWAPHLEGRIFAPYPEPYVLLSDTARAKPLLIVQPIPYLAGHTLDKYVSVFGAGTKVVQHTDLEPDLEDL